MKILFDTNVFIYREESALLPKSLRELERSLNESDHTVYMHPLSVEEVRNDPDDERRQSAESRVETYPELSYPPTPSGSDTEFRECVPETTDSNQQVDNALLFTVYENTADFLVTEDTGIHSKARNLSIQDRVFTIEEARDYFTSEPEPISEAPDIYRTKLKDLDLEDPIFDSLRADYDGFDEWAREKGDREAWVNEMAGGDLGAVLVLKPGEVESIGDDPPLERTDRLKISTLKVAPSRRGSKLGERLISIAVRRAIREEHDRIYLTYYPDSNSEDKLVQLLTSFGFSNVTSYDDGEAVFQKRLIPGPKDDPSPREMVRKFYPSFRDGEEVDKFLVPVQPHFHDKLFTSYQKRQSELSEFWGASRSEGNAIRKAYLSHAQTKQIEPGDLLLFYRSQDQKEITSLGVCEVPHFRCSEFAEVKRIVGKRSVFTDDELRDMVNNGETTVLMFWWHFHLDDPISLDKLRRDEVLDWAPQTTQQITEETYEYIKSEGGLDERFARN
jgi:predicted nucleic acid-binding protein/GNAT superfamily N-acetyltransferase